VIVSNLDTPYWIDHFLGMRRPGRPITGRWVGAAKVFE